MTERTLNDIMEIDHVIKVTADGVISEDTPGIYAPEVYVDCDDDGQISRDDDAEMMRVIESAGWTVVNGYSGQQGYAGPIMHPSEFIGGGIEDHIREIPGYYVVCSVETLDDDETPAGWVLLFREIPQQGNPRALGEYDNGPVTQA